MNQIVGRGQGLDSVKVKRDELLACLLKNCEKHIKDYKEAYQGFIEATVAELEQLTQNARNGEIKTHIIFDEPKSHEEEYSTVIEMLQMCVDEEIYITKEQFRSYVQDKWSWSTAFMLTNTKYLSK